MKARLATLAFAGLAAAALGCGDEGAETTNDKASASSAAAPCRAHGLRIAVGRGSAATGHVLSPYSVRNVSDHPCTLRGFPHIVLLDRSHRPMAVSVQPRSTDFFGHIPIRTVAVPVHGQASFHLAFESGINGGRCPIAHSLRITVPRSSGAVSITLGKQLACPGGVSVSPFTEGRSGLPKQLGQ